MHVPVERNPVMSPALLMANPSLCLPDMGSFEVNLCTVAVVVYERVRRRLNPVKEVLRSW